MELLASEILTPTDANHRWEFPIGVYRQHFAHLFAGEQRHVDFLVRDTAGRVWSLRLRVRDGIHPKPCIIGGWKDYVRANELQEGDQVKLFRLQDGAATGVEYMIELKYTGAFRLWGQRINY